MTKEKLRIDALHERHTGLTPSLSGSFFEAASVCLNRHHATPVEVEILRGETRVVREVDFQAPDDRMRNAWANDIDTTEAGAYGVSLAAVEAEESLVAVRRAETLTGADWYVAPVGVTADDLETCLRLEVSGLDSGNRSALETRLAQKIAQTKRGKSNLPAIASVVGFEQRAVAIRRVEEKS